MMKDLFLADCFGCPLERPQQRPALLQQLWQARVHQAIRGISQDEDVAREVRAHSSGLLELCDAALRQGVAPTSLRGLHVGALEQASLTGAVDPAYAAASLAAHLHGCGVAGCWSVRLREETPLRIGPWLSAAGREHEVLATGDTIEVLSYGRAAPFAVPSCLRLERRAGAWAAPDGAVQTGAVHTGAVHTGAVRLPTARLWDSDVPLFSRAQLRMLQVHEELDAVPVVEAAVSEEFEQAAAFLTRYAPEYVDWSRDIVAGLIPLRGSRTQTQSSTHPLRFGFVAASIHGRPLQMAEALVHETSHEYLHIAELHAQLSDGSDPLLYYSPLRKVGRPIRSILLAYHAVVNILLLYRASLARGYQDDGYCAHYLEHYLQAASGMARDLLSSPGITSAGRSFVQSTCGKLGLALPACDVRPGRTEESVAHVG